MFVRIQLLSKSMTGEEIARELIHVQPGLDYFQHQLQTSLKVPLAAFKAARLFCPSKVLCGEPNNRQRQTGPSPT